MTVHGHTGNQREASARGRRITVALIFFLCVCVAFVAGFAVRGDESLLKRIGFNSLVTGESANPGITVTGNTYDSLSARVAEMEGILIGESLDTYDLDSSTVDVLTAFAESTDDPFLRYYDPLRYAAYVQQSAGKYAGVGALFSEYAGQAYVVDIFEESVAYAAGVEVGDFVVAIDGDRSQAWSTTEVVNALARDDGESVVVTWRRPSSLEAEGGEEFTTTLLCSVYEEQNVSTELADGVGYIKLQQLAYNAADLVERAVNDLEEQGALSFVLDIRNTPGGYLTQAVDIASLFVKSGVIVEVETKDGVSTKTASGQTATDKPLVVLINGDTSAASEVLAAALQDPQRATLIGVATMGKGSVQVVKEMSFGGALRYTAAYYKTPLGHTIDGAGIAPDIAISQNTEASDDAQKDFAIDTARSYISQ